MKIKNFQYLFNYQDWFYETFVLANIFIQRFNNECRNDTEAENTTAELSVHYFFFISSFFLIWWLISYRLIMQSLTNADNELDDVTEFNLKIFRLRWVRAVNFNNCRKLFTIKYVLAPGIRTLWIPIRPILALGTITKPSKLMPFLDLKIMSFCTKM